MLLDKIYLGAFGKFKGKEIDLRQGINIIFAENEGGKSTSHAFIDGIFYGFSKDSLKAKRTDELYEKYKPWQGSDYKGYIELTKDDKYRISRDFSNNSIEVLNLTKGTNISNLAIFKKYSRIEEPGLYFFNMNRHLFHSTFYIRQLESIIDEKASKLLKEKISNFITSNDEKINYHYALEKLEEDLDSYGKPTRTKTKIGSISKRLEEINKEELELDDKRIEYFKGLEILKKEESALEADKKNLLAANVRDNKDLQRQIKSIEEKIINEKSKAVSINDFQQSVELNREIKKDYLQIDELLHANYEVFQIDEDMERDFEDLKSYKEKISELNSVNYSKEMEFLSVDIRNSEKKRNFYLFMSLFSILISFLVIYLSIKFHLYPLFISIVFISIYTYLRLVKFRVNKELVERLKVRMEALKNLSIQKTAKKKNFDRLFNQLTDKYHKKDIDELYNFLKEKVNENDKNRAINEYRKEKSKDIIEKRDKLNKEIEDLENKLNIIFEKYEVTSLRELKDKYENNNIFDLEKSLALKKDLYEKTKIENIKSEEITQTDLSIKEINSIIDSRKLKISTLKGQINLLEASVNKFKDLEEEKDYLIKELEKVEFKRAYTELAYQRLKDLLLENRNKMLPRLKSKIEEILGQITKEKYKKIIIDDNYNISLYDDENEKYVSIENLSRGTIDQLYFAFRLSLIQILFTDNLPIILDDHFANYDDTRLEMALDYLRDYKQLIIFTSNKREINMLNKMNVDYNLINLR